MKVIIIGGGIGGLCLANGLRRSGIQVKVFERQATPSESLAGYGIHINEHGRRALQRCLDRGSWERFEATSTAAGSTMSFRDTTLRLLAERDDAQLSGRSMLDVERRGIGRVELRRLLLDSLASMELSIVEWGRKYNHYEMLHDGRVRVHFEDGASEDSDLVVGADGCHSSVREQLLPNLVREDLGILAIAGRYVLDGNRGRELPRGFTDGSLNNIVPHGKGWMFITSWHSQAPADRDGVESAAEHYVMWAYVVPKANTPVNAKEFSAAQLRDFALAGVRGWSPIFTRLIQGADLTTVAPVWLKSMPVLETWGSSAVTVLGDAIHNMTPMAGVGANTALRDAELLTDVLIESAAHGTSIVQAVSKYETAMRLYANEAVALSRRNAEAASAGGSFQREAFRVLLRLSQASPTVMRKTIGASVVTEQLQYTTKV